MESFQFETDQELSKLLEEFVDPYSSNPDFSDIPQILTIQEGDMETGLERVFDQPDAGLKVVLEKDSHIFRHAREVQTGSRGGYLEGYITLPRAALNKTIYLELSVVPCHEELAIHPHLLHLTIFTENQKRASYKTPLKSPSDWRLKFKIVNCKQVYHIPNDPDANEVALQANCLSFDIGQPILTLGKNKVLVNIISSLQGATKRGNSNSENAIVTNFDVISKRIEEEFHQYPQLQISKDLARNLATKYTNKDHKVELQRCKLRVCVFEPNSSRILTAYSITINNARDKNVGYLNLRSISDPGMCCTAGGWRFFLISEHKLAKDKVSNKQEVDYGHPDKGHPVVPRLELTNRDLHIVSDANIKLNQIPTDADSFEVHGDTFSIVIPHQDAMTIDKINHEGYQIRIFLYRNLDKKHSDSSVGFTYVTHNEFNNLTCPFCFIKSRMSNHLSLIGNNKSRKRSKMGTVCERSPRGSSPGFSPLSDSLSTISSPSSSGGNLSPHYVSGFPTIEQNDNSPIENFEDANFLDSFDILSNALQQSDDNQTFRSQESFVSNSSDFSSPEYGNDDFMMNLTLADLAGQPNSFSNVSLQDWDFNNHSNRLIASDSWSRKGTDASSGGRDGQKVEHSNDPDELAGLTKRFNRLDLVENNKSENVGESSQPYIIQTCVMAEQSVPIGLNVLKTRELFIALSLAMVCMMFGSFGLTVFQNP